MASVRYMVRDVAEVRDFYVGMLGFAVVEEYGPAMAILRHGGLDLWLAGPSSSAAKAMPDGRVKDAGAVFRNVIVKGPGGAQILVEDPSGNPIELFQPRGR